MIAPPRPPRFRGRPTGALVLVLVLSACSAIRFGGPAHDLAGSWEGAVTVQGQRISGSLALEQEGRLLEAAFAAPGFDLDAAGEGEVADDGAVWLELAYDLECPGTALLEGTVSEDDTVLSGEVEATDCTGTITGSFRFTR